MKVRLALEPEDIRDFTTTTKKSKKLNRQNNNSSRFFVHFFPVTYDCIREMPNFTFYGGCKQATAQFSIFF